MKYYLIILLIFYHIFLINKVFSDDFEKYEKKIQRIKLECYNFLNHSIVYLTDGNNFYQNLGRSSTDQLFTVGEEVKNFGKILSIKKKKGKVFLINYERTSIEENPETYEYETVVVKSEIYVNFELRKAFNGKKELTCY